MALDNIYQALASPKLSTKDKCKAMSLQIRQVWLNWEDLVIEIMKQENMEALYISVHKRNKLMYSLIEDAKLGGVDLFGVC